MTNRVTKRQLEAQVEHLNVLTGNPIDTYSKTEDGRYKANAGNYHLDYAYGGVKLCKVCGSGRGVTDISVRGTKGQISDIIHAMTNMLYREERNG